LRSREAISADVVLVGAGHAHVQVLRGFMMKPVPGVRLTLVVDHPLAVYSGMVPGLVAGDYTTDDISIDGVPLARRARARVVLEAAVRVDPVARRVEFRERPPLPYDVASLDVGSTVSGLELPGVPEHALATRPVARFVEALERRLAAPELAPDVLEGRPLQVAVVGGGAAGVELAFCLEARLREAGRLVRLTLFCDSSRLLSDSHPRVSRRLEADLRRRGISVRSAVRALAVDAESLHLQGERVPSDLVVWATGAAPPPLCSDSPLPLDERGFIRVRGTLQVEGHDDLFAVGDCASLTEQPWVRKAGVYAVREGPVLAANLRARLSGRRLRAYRAQRDFLALLNLGGGRALASKWGAVVEGPGLWRLKDAIDRRFMRRFRVLAPAAQASESFPTPESMGMEVMACGGCAAKLGPSALERALGRLPEAPPEASVRLGVGDDAALVEVVGGGLQVSSVDGFRAFADDPWLVGRVAAVNAASDVFAKGGRPRHALALVTVPESDAAREEETLHQVLCGVRAALDPQGIALVGGHSTTGEELFVALSISGELPSESDWLGLEDARPGDQLILTRPLGSGVLLAADMQGRCPGRWLQTLYEVLPRQNANAARVAREQRAHACTDVSGFGLVGHLLEMLRASEVSAVLDPARLPAYPGARELLALGLRSTYHEQNAALRAALRMQARFAQAPETELIFDPQTAGGLLLAAPSEGVAEVLRALREGGDAEAAVVGCVGPPRGDAPLLELAELPATR